jgi:hypothetical protein
VRIVGPNFSVGLRVKDHIIVEAERPVRYMRGWPLQRVLNLARRWHWKVEYLNDAERAQNEDQCDRTQRPST